MGMVDLDAVGELLRLARGDGRARRTRPAERERYVVVRAYSGVFFGRIVARRGTEVDLRDVRHVHSWTSTGLSRKALTVEDVAEIGVGTGSKVSGVASAVTVLDVKLIADASDAARKVIEAIPCQ